MGGIIVKNPGFLSSIQDLGRFGQQWCGLSPAGAMDTKSMQIANLLVGNNAGEAVIEATMMGPELEFTCDETIALCGGNMMPALDGKPIPMNCAVAVKKGQKLSFGTLQSGCRTYIAFAGGMDIPAVMGSKATLLRDKIGGFMGRALAAGDEIALLQPMKELPGMELRVYNSPDSFSNEVTLRVVLGPQDDYFTQEGIEAFLSQEGYRVTYQCDRQGCRLKGKEIEHKATANIISDGIAMGAVQVPGNGQPIILLAERQSTGGYTKIATVASADLYKIGQCRPGTHIVFSKISVEEAQQLIIEDKDFLDSIKDRMQAIERKR